MATLFSSSLRPKLRALAAGFVPEIAGATAEQWAALEHAVDRAVAARPASLRRQLVLFVRLLDSFSRVRLGRGLAALDPPRLTALLEGMARSRLLLLRRGIWGLRTLLMLGWYTQPEVSAALGYRANSAGWSVRR